MDDLVAFLSARLDEREAGAWSVHDVAKCDWLMYEEDLAAGAREGHCDCGEPDRVRREVAAKRAIIEIHQAGSDPCDAHGPDLHSIPCDTLLWLAQPYADYPDCRQEWKPS
jgi:hypothetical protein